jgi:hypothetical protein
MAIDLITLEEVKNYADIKSTNQDAQINLIIPSVSQFIKTYCGRTFVDYVNEEKIEVKHGGTDSLFLDEPPVITVTSVEYSSDYGKTYAALTEFTDYVIDPEANAILSTSETFPRLLNGYRITYTGGFETLPDDIKIAALDLSVYYLRNDMAIKSQGGLGRNTVAIEYVTSVNLPAHIRRVLDLHRVSYV